MNNIVDCLYDTCDVLLARIYSPCFEIEDHISVFTRIRNILDYAPSDPKSWMVPYGYD